MLDWHEYRYYSQHLDENDNPVLLFRITIPETMTSDYFYEFLQEVNKLNNGVELLEKYSINILK